MIVSTSSIKITEKEFAQFSKFIYAECGIHLTIGKKSLLENRLQKRVRHLGLKSFAAYLDYVMTPKGQTDELVTMIDAVATNKTDFFREPVHFQFLEREVIPAWRTSARDTPFKVWSAACSTGEEPYSIAMVLQDLSAIDNFYYRITATDISTKVLSRAVNAVYPERLAATIPLPMRKRYLLRSVDLQTPTIKICPELRSKVLFKRVNLMDSVPDVENDFNLIFCRNVLIYFDRATQEQVVKKLVARLRPGGYLFIGHSESIYHMDVSLTQLRPTIFQKN